MSNDEKKCPACAETVKAEAVKCRFCGYDFATKKSPASASPVKSGGYGSKIAVGIGAILLLAYCAGSDGPPKDPEAEASQERAGVISNRVNALKVTADELYQAYDANEAGAQARYGSRVLEVSGVVVSVDLDFMDEPVVRLATSNQFSSAMVDLVEADKPRASMLQKGQNLTVVCQGLSEVAGSPSLKDCAVVD